MTRTKKSAQPSNEQQLLFSEDAFLPETLPKLEELRPSHNLSAVFAECHNYIYANEGMLRDKIFHEIIKLILIKLYDEQSQQETANFGITKAEYEKTISDRCNSFINRLGKLYSLVKTQYQDFLIDDRIRLTPLTLAYIVSKLQHISLKNTPGDIKGEAFQKFIGKHQRGDRGEFFTPYPIVKLAVEMISPKPDEKVIDPACGSGGFLVQAIDHIKQHHADVSLSSYIKKNISGLEFNPDIALAAMLRLVFEGGQGREIMCTNALQSHDQLNNFFDIVLTNPPFGSKGKVEDRQILSSYDLARKWHQKPTGWEMTQTILPGQSPDILFIERSLQLLRPGGRMAIVLPDGLLQNISSDHIRYWLRSQADILSVVSIPSEAFIPYGTGIKTSLILLQKFPATQNSCFMAQIQKIGYDVKGQPQYKRNAAGIIQKNQSGQPMIDTDLDQISKSFLEFNKNQFKQANNYIYVVKNTLLNSRLDVEHYLPDDQKLIEYLKSIEAKPLGKIADVVNECDNFREVGHDEIRYIAISDVDYRTMQVVSQQIIKAYEAPSRAKYRVFQGDIITAISGASTGTPRQATALITEDEDGAICSNGFAVLRNMSGIEPLFLLAYMRTDYYLRQVKRMMTGHAIPTISIDDLAKILVPIPSTSDQQRITRTFSRIQAMRKEALKAGEVVVNEISLLLNQFV